MHQRPGHDTLVLLAPHLPASLIMTATARGAMQSEVHVVKQLDEKRFQVVVVIKVVVVVVENKKIITTCATPKGAPVLP
eukprot:scaffold339826_cov19-Prasinocladus_malaysianus.AAC.1